MTLTLNTDSSYSRFLIASLILHLFVSLVLLLWSGQVEKTKLPETQITWVNLGSPLSIEKTSGVAEVKGKEVVEEVKPAVAKKTIETPKEAVKEISKVKETTPPKETVKTKEISKPKELAKEIVSLNAKKVKETAKTTENKEVKKSSTQTSSNKTTSNNTAKQDSQISSALAKITGDLANEQKAQAGSGSTTGQGSATGSSGGVNSECNSYAGQVKQRILGNWGKIKGEIKPARPPVATIRIGSSGQVSSISWKQKSGDLAWDNSAQKAIQSTSFPPLPQNCAIALSGGIAVQFGR